MHFYSLHDAAFSILAKFRDCEKKHEPGGRKLFFFLKFHAACLANTYTVYRYMVN